MAKSSAQRGRVIAPPTSLLSGNPTTYRCVRAEIGILKKVGEVLYRTGLSRIAFNLQRGWTVAVSLTRRTLELVH
jgi:hypothetical protein